MNDTFANYTNRTASARGNNERNSFTTKFGAYRKYAKTVSLANRNDYAEKEKKKAENREEMSERKAKAIELELEDAFKTVVKNRQQIMTSLVDRLGNNCKKAIGKFAMIPPRPENILKMENAEKRIDSMTETEFQMHIADYSDNYQESALWHSIAEKHGKKYDIPFEPEEASKNVDRLVSLIKKNVIAFIADDPIDHMDMETYFRGDEAKDIYGEMNYLTNYFDNLPVYVEDDDPIPQLTDKKDLESAILKARQTCWNNNAKGLWEEAAHVSSDIQRNGLTTENIVKAEKLLKIVGEMFPDE